MLATETPQESVNAARPRPVTCNIVIVILWSRMGTPLPDSLRKPNGELYLSGTEWEYEDAVMTAESAKTMKLIKTRSQRWGNLVRTMFSRDVSHLSRIPQFSMESTFYTLLDKTPDIKRYAFEKNWPYILQDLLLAGRTEWRY